MNERALLAAVLLARGWTVVDHGVWAHVGPRSDSQVALRAGDGTVIDIHTSAGDVSLFSPEGWVDLFDSSIPNRVVYGAAIAAIRDGATT